MKKFVSLVLVFVLVVFALSSCGVETADAGENNPFEFAAYDAGSGLRVYVDKGTGVCYLWCWSSYKGSLTVMLDEDGRPLTYWEDGYENE